jgi:hypothetical protein
MNIRFYAQPKYLHIVNMQILKLILHLLLIPIPKVYALELSAQWFFVYAGVCLSLVVTSDKTFLVVWDENLTSDKL